MLAPETARAALPGNGLQEASLLGSKNGSVNPTKSAQRQAESRNHAVVIEAKRELLREAVHEACGFVRLHAEVCQALAEAGDDGGLLHSVARLIAFTKHVARVGSDLRTLRDEARDVPR